MNILVTGAKGFVGQNLVAALKAVRDGKDKSRGITEPLEIYEFDIDIPKEKLEEYCQKADFIYHLAGVNRPKDESEFMTGNYGFTSELLSIVEKSNKKPSIMISSSIQAALDNPYGRSKRAGEELIADFCNEKGMKAYIYRFQNLFGKWGRPNYNSVVATFCYNIARDLPITINDRNHKIALVYIDDVVDELIKALIGKENREGEFCRVPVEHIVTLGELADMIYTFKESRKTGMIPDMTDNSFSKKLYSTYLSYLDPKDFSYKLKMNFDDRGSFTEILRTANAGQVSVNISKPGITKGQHWHHTKNEKFVVVHGHGLIQLRKIGSDEVVNYEVSGEEITVIDMIPGYTHNIINLSKTEDLVTLMWANECFNPNKPDTFFEEV